MSVIQMYFNLTSSYIEETPRDNTGTKSRLQCTFSITKYLFPLGEFASVWSYIMNISTSRFERVKYKKSTAEYSARRATILNCRSFETRIFYARRLFFPLFCRPAAHCCVRGRPHDIALGQKYGFHFLKRYITVKNGRSQRMDWHSSSKTIADSVLKAD